MLTDEKVAELAIAAHAGALLLDDKQPGWAFRVDPVTLNMRFSDQCVLGQSMKAGLFRHEGVYLSKLRQLGLNHATQQDYGFAFVMHTESTEAWNALTGAWRDEIAARATPPTTAAPAEQKELVLAG